MPKVAGTNDPDSQLIQLQHELYSPESRLANTVRRAVVVASTLGKHEYRMLFEMHLSGIEKGGGESERPGLPRGYEPEINPAEAFIYDRTRLDGKIQSHSLEQIEEILDSANSSIASAEPGAEAYLQIKHDLARHLSRIRNRVNTFVARMLAIPAAETQEVSSLTGLPTLSEFTRDLTASLEKRRDFLSLVFVDVDNLKALNSKIGHDRADGVLRTVAGLLSSTILRRGTVYHRSGDEFLAIFENHSAAETSMLMSRVCERVAMHDFGQGLTPGEVTVSAGVVEHEIHGRGANVLREAAIRANQMAKAAGKNQVVVPPPSI